MKKKLEEYMDEPAYCPRCRRVTTTKSWDCTCCGVAKGHPKAWLEERDLDRKGEIGSTVKPEDLQVTDATIERIRNGHTSN